MRESLLSREPLYFTLGFSRAWTRGSLVAALPRRVNSHSSEESTEPLYRTDKGQAAGTCAPRTKTKANLLSAPIAQRCLTGQPKRVQSERWSFAVRSESSRTR